MNSTDKFIETELPTIDKFYSKLKGDNISTDDYNHAKKVWDLFKLNNHGDYHDLYACADTVQ